MTLMSAPPILTVKGLSVMCRIGVPEEERSEAQRLLLDLRFAGSGTDVDPGDEINRTVDYHAVALRASAIAGERERRLIETLAGDLGRLLMEEFHLAWIEVRVRKFILPDAEWVSVEIRRDAASD